MAQLKMFAVGLFATLLFAFTGWAPSVEARQVREGAIAVRITGDE